MVLEDFLPLWERSGSPLPSHLGIETDQNSFTLWAERCGYRASIKLLYEGWGANIRNADVGIRALIDAMDSRSAEVSFPDLHRRAL